MKPECLMYILINHYGLRVINDRPDLSSERAPHRDKTTTFGQKVASPGAGSTPRHNH
jgi:hypothetical protein